MEKWHRGRDHRHAPGVIYPILFVAPSLKTREPWIAAACLHAS